jgi:hypothetical protein
MLHFGACDGLRANLPCAKKDVREVDVSSIVDETSGRGEGASQPLIREN